MSKYKIIFTLVIWTMGLGLEITKYTTEIIDTEDSSGRSFWH